MKSPQNSFSQMTRKRFLKTAAMFSASALSADMGTAQSRDSSDAQLTSASNSVTLENSHWRLSLNAGAGLKAQLVHSPSGIALAGGEYSYSMGTPAFGEARETKTTRPERSD